MCYLQHSALLLVALLCDIIFVTWNKNTRCNWHVECRWSSLSRWANCSKYEVSWFYKTYLFILQYCIFHAWPFFYCSVLFSSCLNELYFLIFLCSSSGSHHYLFIYLLLSILGILKDHILCWQTPFDVIYLYYVDKHQIWKSRVLIIYLSICLIVSAMFMQ